MLISPLTFLPVPETLITNEVSDGYETVSAGLSSGTSVSVSEPVSVSPVSGASSLSSLEGSFKYKTMLLVDTSSFKSLYGSPQPNNIKTEPNTAKISALNFLTIVFLHISFVTFFVPFFVIINKISQKYYYIYNII